MKDPDFSYVNENGKRVSGAPAFVHHVYTEMGGVAEYNEKVGRTYSEEERRLLNERMNEKLERDAKKNRFKAI